MWITHRHVAALGKRLVDTTLGCCAEKSFQSSHSKKSHSARRISRVGGKFRESGFPLEEETRSELVLGKRD